MASIHYSKWRRGLRSVQVWAWLALPLGSASCTPILADQAGIGPLAVSEAPESFRRLAELPLPPALSGPEAPSPPTLQPASTLAFRGQTALDELRSHDCLAQAIHYEAASESEEGQRAVAQVVLNRVRHPSWPNSVCGVVYQGPLRAGGGCQFSFTCDGSLGRPAVGAAWAQARRLAAEALAGRSRSGVGLATHYHTHAVSPAWAPRLTSIGTIGAHAFYRLPGRVGEAAAFQAAYSGSEPMPRPYKLMPRSTPGAGLAAFSLPAHLTAPVPVVSANPISPPPIQPVETSASTVREEYRHSGQWRKDAPAAITGRSDS